MQLIRPIHSFTGSEGKSLEEYVAAKRLKAQVMGQYKGGALNRNKIQTIAKEISNQINNNLNIK
jgi:hypothetical protein